MRNRLLGILLCGLAVFLLPPEARAADTLIPPLQWDQWRLVVHSRVQGDTLLSSDLPEDRQSDFEWRRAQVGLRLTHATDWRFRVSGEFRDDARLQDLAVEYRGWPVWIEAGRVAENFGLASQSGTSGQSLAERPQAAALGGGYGLGVGASLAGGFWGLSAGAYGLSGNPTLDGRDRALTARATLVPARSRNWLLHLGIGTSLRQPEDDLLQLSALAETVLVSGLSVQSAQLSGVDRYTLYNGELALRAGPILFSGEWLGAAVDAPSASDPSYNSYYVAAGWVLTGERRPYSTRQGIFGGLTPKRAVGKGGIGAVEIAVRHGRTDLREEGLGGEIGEVQSAGLQWLPTRRLRLQLNVLKITETRGIFEEEDTVVQLHTQIRF